MGELPYEDTQLPSNGRRVRVRLVATPELTEMAMLPDLLGFTHLATQLGSSEAAERAKVDTRKLAVESKRYEARLAHRVVLDPHREVPPPEACQDCSYLDDDGTDVVISHPPGMLTVAQAERLHSRDLKHVALVAVRAERLAALHPFSEAPTVPGSGTSAEHGA
jgi:hypothetical protein